MLFNRGARIEFEGENIRDIEDLRIQFDVDKNDGETFNSGTIHVFNLNETTRKAAARTIPFGDELVKPIKVTLYVGYQNELVQIISGTLLESRNYRVGPDWITEMVIKSGLEAAHKGFTQVSYATKTPAKKIAEDLLAPLNMDIKYTDDANQALQNKFLTSFSASALAIDEIQSFLSRYNLEFTIEEHDQCLIYKKDSPRDQQTARNNLNTFKPTGGMIGTPQILRYGVVFRALLRPSIRILQRIYVESVSINSSIQNNPSLAPEYYVKRIKHVGDTRSDDWFTEIEAAYTGLVEGNF